MPIEITQDEMNILNLNGISYDDIKDNIELSRASGLDDATIREQFTNTIKELQPITKTSFNTTGEIKNWQEKGAIGPYEYAQRKAYLYDGTYSNIDNKANLSKVEQVFSNSSYNDTVEQRIEKQKQAKLERDKRVNEGTASFIDRVGAAVDRWGKASLEAQKSTPSLESQVQQNLTSLENNKKEGKIGFAEAAANSYLSGEWTPFIGGFIGGIDDKKEHEIQAKIIAGKPIRQDELDFLNDRQKTRQEEAVRGYTIGGEIGNSLLPSMIRFSTELGATSWFLKGLGGVTGIHLPALAKNATLGQQALHHGRNMLIGGAVNTISPFAWNETFANLQQRLLQNGMQFTDKGEVLFQEAKEKPAISFLKSMGETFVMFASEYSGALLGLPVKGVNAAATKYVGTPVSNYLKSNAKITKFIDKIMPELSKLYEKANKLKPQGKNFEFLKDMTKFDGFVEELGEEVVEDLLNLTLGTQDQERTLENYAKAVFKSPDEWAVLAGAIALQGGLLSVGSHVLGGYMERNGATDDEIVQTLNNLSESEIRKEISKITNDGTLDVSSGYSKLNTERYQTFKENLIKAGKTEQYADDVLFTLNKMDEIMLSKYNSNGAAEELIRNRNLKLNLDNLVDRTEQEIYNQGFNQVSQDVEPKFQAASGWLKKQELPKNIEEEYIEEKIEGSAEPHYETEIELSKKDIKHLDLIRKFAKGNKEKALEELRKTSNGGISYKQIEEIYEKLENGVISAKLLPNGQWEFNRKDYSKFTKNIAKDFSSGLNLGKIIEKYLPNYFEEENNLIRLFEDFNNGKIKFVERNYGKTIRTKKTRKVLNPEWNPLFDGTEEKTEEIIEHYEDNTTTDKVGHGYSGYSMSNNARIAYSQGVMPYSKWTKTNLINSIKDIVEKYNIPFDVSKIEKTKFADLKSEYLKQEGYHHTSKFYNTTEFYKIDIEKILENKEEINNPNIYFQSMLSGINPKQKVDVVDLSSNFTLDSKLTKKELSNYIKSLINKKITTADKKAILQFTKSSKRVGKKDVYMPSHIVDSSRYNKKQLSERNTAINNITDLIQNSVLIEIEKNNKKTIKPNVDNYLRFYVPVRINNDIFTVRIVAENNLKDDLFNIKVGNVYDLIIDKKMMASSPSTKGNFAKPSPTNSITQSQETSSVEQITIEDMLRDIQDADGNIYYQNEDSNVSEKNRGFIKFTSDETIITLLKKNDASTVMHELAHLYLHDLKELAKVDKRAENDYKEVCKVLKFNPESDYGLDEFIEFNENFARSFEAYLFNGEAPTAKMKPIFERFKEFLREVYRYFSDLNVEFSPEVKECFDRLFTTDEEYEKEVRPLYIKNDELVKSINEQNGLKYRIKNNFNSIKEAWKSFYDTVIIPIDTRLFRISPKLKVLLRKHTFDLTINQKKDAEKIKPFLLKILELKNSNAVINDNGHEFNAYNYLSYSLNNADSYTVNKIIKHFNMEKEFNAVRNLLDELWDELKSVGLDVGYLESYYPRMVKTDKTDAFVEMFEKKAFDEEVDIAQKILSEEDAEYSSVKRQINEKDIHGLWNNEDKAKLINTSIRGFGKNNILLSRIGQVKFERLIDKLTPEQQQFYEPIENALSLYILGARKNIEERKFFGIENKDVSKLRASIKKKRETLREVKTRTPMQAKFKEINRLKYELSPVEIKLETVFGELKANKKRIKSLSDDSSFSEEKMQKLKETIKIQSELIKTLSERRERLKSQLDWVEKHPPLYVKNTVVKRLQTEITELSEEIGKILGDNEHVEDSIGRLVLDLAEKGVIHIKDEREIRELLVSRFNSLKLNPFALGMRDVSTIITLNDFTNAITQITDLTYSAFKFGFFNTIEGIKKAENLTREDLGIKNIAEEFRTSSDLSKWVNKQLKLIGLDLIDGFAKNTAINAAVVSARKKAKSDNKKFNEQLEFLFGENAQKVKQDLINDKTTDEIIFIAFNDLADIQPITTDQMTAGYQSAFRPLYVLKTYSIKALDIFRNECIFKITDGINLLKKGNDEGKELLKEGIQNIIRLQLLLWLFGIPQTLLKDFLLNREFNIPETIIDNLFIFGIFSRYLLKKSSQNPASIYTENVKVPAIQAIGDLWSGINQVRKGDKDVKDLYVWSRVPFVGRLYYNWLGGKKDKRIDL